MKYSTPKAVIRCEAWNCSFWDEIELVERIPYSYGVWVMPVGWHEGWTVNEDGEAICPNHEDEPEETLSASERNPGLAGGPK